MEKEILTSIWSAQPPTVGQNIQQLCCWETVPSSIHETWLKRTSGLFHNQNCFFRLNIKMFFFRLNEKMSAALCSAASSHNPDRQIWNIFAAKKKVSHFGIILELLYSINVPQLEDEWRICFSFHNSANQFYKAEGLKFTFRSSENEMCFIMINNYKGPVEECSASARLLQKKLWLLS